MHANAFVADVEARRIHGSVRNKLFGDATTPPTVGAYKVRKMLRTWGGAALYEALDERRGVPVHMWCADGPASDPSAHLEAERERLATLQRCGVVPAPLEVGVDGQTVFCAVDAASWPPTSMPTAPTPQLVPALRRWVRLARTVACVHRCGHAHGAITPGAVVQSVDGELGLDFGWALLCGLRGPDAAATPPQAAVGPPETQGRYSPAAVADVFGFCAAMWTHVCGSKPFEGDAPVAPGHVLTPPVRAKLPRPLIAALRRGLAARPGERTPNLGEVHRALRRVTRRRKLATMSAVAASVAVGGIFAWVAWLAPPHPPGCPVPERPQTVESDTPMWVRSHFDRAYDRAVRQIVSDCASGNTAPRTERAATCVTALAVAEQEAAAWLRSSEGGPRGDAPPRVAELAAPAACAPSASAMPPSLGAYRWLVRGQLAADAGPDLERALTAATAERDEVGALQVRIALARARADGGEPGEAMPLAAAALRDAQRLGARQLEVDASVVLALCSAADGHGAGRTEAWFSHAESVAGTSNGRARALRVRGEVALADQRFDAAARAFAESSEAYARTGRPILAAWVRLRHGDALRNAGRTPQATAAYEDGQRELAALLGRANATAVLDARSPGAGDGRASAGAEP